MTVPRDQQVPVFEQQHYNVTIGEDVETGSEVVDVRARDETLQVCCVVLKII